MHLKIDRFLFHLVFITFLISHAFSQNAEFESFKTGSKVKYATNKHLKSMGLNITIEYPSLWKAAEGERPHIVQKFLAPSGSGFSKSIIVLIDKTPTFLKVFSSENLMDALSTDSMLQEMIPDGSDFIEGGVTKYDGQAGCWIVYNMNTERAGFKLTIYTIQHMFFYSGKTITVQCMVAGSTVNKSAIKDQFDSYLPLFRPFYYPQV
jgi:hypothetical protein